MAWTMEQRADLAFAVRKFAEALWDLAKRIEEGAEPERIDRKWDLINGLFYHARDQVRRGREDLS